MGVALGYKKAINNRLAITNNTKVRPKYSSLYRYALVKVISPPSWMIMPLGFKPSPFKITAISFAEITNIINDNNHSNQLPYHAVNIITGIPIKALSTRKCSNLSTNLLFL